MDKYTRKTTALIKKFASFFAKQKIDDDLKTLAMTIFDKEFEGYKDIKAEDKEFVDLRIALTENNSIKKLFPTIATKSSQEEMKANSLLLNFIAFEATALPQFLNKQEYKFEDLQEFISFTYRPLKNTSGNDNIISAYFLVSMFFFTDGKFEYVIKPNLQYVLSPEVKINETAILKLI